MSVPSAPLPRWVELGLLPAVNVLTAFIVSGLVVVAIGANPFDAVRIMIYGALGYGEGFGYTLFYTTNFIFTGLSVAVAFHAGLFNIGGDGQAYIGGLGVALVCLALDAVLPWWALALVALAASFAFGAAWALVPGWLQASRGSHVVITTIMFNFLASALMVYLLVHVMTRPGSMAPETRTFSDAAELPHLGGLMRLIGVNIGSAPLNISLFLALIVSFLVWALIWRTRFGYEIRVFGINPTAARYAGMRPVRITVLVMLISGGLAGMMALNPIMGDQNRLALDFSSGAGFVGIAVSLMGRSHPFGIFLAALLFGVLYQGGAELAFEIPEISRDMIVLIQGLVILFAGALEHMYRPAMSKLFARRRYAEEAAVVTPP